MQMFVTIEWLRSHILFFYMACFVLVAMICCASCCGHGIMTTFPQNYIFMLVFTIFEAFMVGCVTSMYTTQSVVFAVAVTAALTLGLSLYAMTTKSDFTGCGPFCAGIMISLMCFGALCFIFPLVGMAVPRGIQLAYAFFAVLIYSLYL